MKINRRIGIKGTFRRPSGKSKSIEERKEESQRRRIARLELSVRQLTGEVKTEREPVKTLLWRNFLRGIMRGIGTAIGFALVGTIGVYILTKLAERNMAGLGAFFADLVRWIQRSM